VRDRGFGGEGRTQIQVAGTEGRGSGARKGTSLENTIFVEGGNDGGHLMTLTSRAPKGRRPADAGRG